MRSSTLLPLSIALLSLSAAPAAAQQQTKRPYYDTERSLEKQRDAAKAAKEKARASQDAGEIGALLGDNSVNVRDDVFRALVEREDEALLKQLGRFLGEKRAPLTSAAVAELYGQCKYKEGRKALEKVVLKSRDEATVLEAIWALEVIGEASSTGKVLEKLWKKRNPSYRVQGDALIALCALDPARGEAHAKKALEHKVLPLRIAGLVALGKLGPERAAAAAVDVIGGKEIKKGGGGWEARLLFAATDALEAWLERSKDKALFGRAVDALIQRLERAEGLSKYRCGRALGDLTGEALGDDPEIWRGWWASRKESFAPKDKAPPAPKKKKKKKKSTKKKKGDDDDEPKKDEPRKDGRVETGGAAKTRVRFHGIPIHSNRLLFAQDVSGGMKNPMDKSESDSPTKMAFSSRELKRVLKALGDDVWTNVCFFATEYTFTAPNLFPIKRAREKLISFVSTKAVTPSGRTKGRSNLYDPLATAFEDPQIDTVFFLSEGGPTEGQYLRTERFMRHLNRLNVYSRVTVHCLQVTTSSFGERFLRRLAEETGGTFYDMEFLKKAHGKK